MIGIDEPLASVALNTGQVDEAIRIYRRVIEAKTRLYGSSRPTSTDDNLGEALRLAHRPDEAIPVLRRSWDQAQHQSSYAAQQLAAALRAANGDAREAARARSPGDRDHRGALRAGQSLAGGSASGLGEDLLALGRPGEALAPLERAARMAAGPGEQQGLARFGLARALWESGGDRARALALAESARAAFRDLAARHGAYYNDDLAAADRWLDERSLEQARGPAPLRAARRQE